MTIHLLFFILFFLIDIRELPKYGIWLILGGSLSIGSLIGYFMTRMVRVGICIMGCWVGLVLGILADNILLSRFESLVIEYGVIINH
jgi:hypothetical protein